ncbi:MAG: ATP-binding protein [Cyanobacteria bacterium J06648_10]
MAYHNHIVSQLKRQAQRRVKSAQPTFLNANFFSRLSISHKLNVGFGLLVFLTFLLVGRNAWGSLFAAQNIQQTQQLRVPTALASSQAQQELLKMSAHIRGYLVTGSSEYRNQYYLSRQTFEQELATMIRLLATSSAIDNSEQLNELESLYTQWRQIPEELFFLSDQLLDNQPALKLFQEKGELSLLKIQSETQALINLQAARSPSTENVAMLKEIANFQTSSALVGSSLRAYIITRTPDFRFEYAGKLRIANQHWEEINANLEQLTLEQQNTVQKIQSHRQQLLAIVPELLTIVEGDHYREDLFIFSTQAEPLAAEMATLLNDIVLKQQQRLEDELERSRAGLSRAQLHTLLGSFIALAIAFKLALLLRHKIADPIVRLTRATAQVIEGNLDAKTAVESEDEIGLLAKTFNQMTDYLKASHEDLQHNNSKLASKKKELESKNIQINQALSALQETQTQLIQTEKMSSLGQMVAGIAHEINNPVSFIHGNLPCLQEYTTDLIELIDLYKRCYTEEKVEISERKEDIDLDFLLTDIPRTITSMQTGTQRIRDIVLSLRNFSRLDESDMKQTTVTEGLESTLLILQSRLSMQAFRPAINLVKQYGELPKIECYPGQLNQVFLNILANAIDAIDSVSHTRKQNNSNDHSWIPTITITTDTRLSEKDEQQVVIEISDNGGGMDTPVQQRIFDPFFTTKPVGSGTGMGLSVSHKIVVDGHHGTLECTSRKGTGTTLQIVLPCKQAVS